MRRLQHNDSDSNSEMLEGRLGNDEKRPLPSTNTRPLTCCRPWIQMQHAFILIILLYLGSIPIHMWLMDPYGYPYSVVMGCTDETDNPGLEILLSRASLPSAARHRPCRADAPTIVSPTVRKGLNNQRMWIVQDILAAAIMGANI
jgi:hypothetical protein